MDLLSGSVTVVTDHDQWVYCDCCNNAFVDNIQAYHTLPLLVHGRIQGESPVDSLPRIVSVRVNGLWLCTAASHFLSPMMLPIYGSGVV